MSQDTTTRVVKIEKTTEADEISVESLPQVTNLETQSYVSLVTDKYTQDAFTISEGDSIQDITTENEKIDATKTPITNVQTDSSHSLNGSGISTQRVFPMTDVKGLKSTSSKDTEVKQITQQSNTVPDDFTSSTTSFNNINTNVNENVNLLTTSISNDISVSSENNSERDKGITTPPAVKENITNPIYTSDIKTSDQMQKHTNTADVIKGSNSYAFEMTTGIDEKINDKTTVRTPNDVSTLESGSNLNSSATQTVQPSFPTSVKSITSASSTSNSKTFAENNNTDEGMINIRNSTTTVASGLTSEGEKVNDGITHSVANDVTMSIIDVTTQPLMSNDGNAGTSESYSNESVTRGDGGVKANATSISSSDVTTAQTSESPVVIIPGETTVMGTPITPLITPSVNPSTDPVSKPITPGITHASTHANDKSLAPTTRIARPTTNAIYTFRTTRPSMLQTLKTTAQPAQTSFKYGAPPRSTSVISGVSSPKMPYQSKMPAIQTPGVTTQRQLMTTPANSASSSSLPIKTTHIVNQPKTQGPTLNPGIATTSNTPNIPTSRVRQRSTTVVTYPRTTRPTMNVNALSTAQIARSTTPLPLQTTKRAIIHTTPLVSQPGTQNVMTTPKKSLLSTPKIAPPVLNPVSSTTPSYLTTPEIMKTPAGILTTAASLINATLGTSSGALNETLQGESTDKIEQRFPLWVVLTCVFVSIMVLAILALCIFVCLVCRRRKKGTKEVEKPNGDLWASKAHNYVSAMNEYTYIDMATISSNNTTRKDYSGGLEGLKMETAFNDKFNYSSLEDDRGENWKNFWLSKSKEQLDTAGLSALTDLDDYDYAQNISTFRAPSKKTSASSTPIKKEQIDDIMQQPQSSNSSMKTKSNPSSHEYAVPVITPKQSASSSFDSLHSPPSSEDVNTEMNFPAIRPPSDIAPLHRKDKKSKHSPAKRSSKAISEHRNSRLSEDEIQKDYRPITVIYNENTQDQLI